MNSPIVRLVALVMMLATTPAAIAQAISAPEHPERAVVIELFSSQSCGNCPIANENAATLARRKDVVAMTYPVGYWDYLGWDDTFAKPEFTARQKDYNRTLKHRGPYTPQIVYSGVVHGSGVNMVRIGENFLTRDVTPYPATVVIGKDEISVAGDATGGAVVMLVRFRPGMTSVTPGGGANEGKPMKYYNLVTSIQKLGDWKGGPATFKAKCDHGCTVLVQKDGPTGPVLGVAERK